VARPRYHVRIKNLDEREKWDLLTATIPDEMKAAWDHLANTPWLFLSSRCTPRTRSGRSSPNTGRQVPV